MADGERGDRDETEIDETDDANDGDRDRVECEVDDGLTPAMNDAEEPPVARSRPALR